MKHFNFSICLIASLLISSFCVAGTSTRNAVGVTITFLDVLENNTAQEVLLSAMSLKGTKYKFGGSSPETGFDCSGFVNYVYNQVANLKLPRTAHGISRVGEHVSKHELVPGDLVFFNTTRRAFSHVGIYVGKGNFIHAPRTGSTVRVESMHTSYWKKRFNGAKRLDAVAMN
jgi:cell wall-associated NlpC family hydrolase